jgi:hypothetical protein
MTKFNVGDVVIGNILANDYGITVEGWKGEVVDTDPHSINNIFVKDLATKDKYWVDSNCFDLYNETPKKKPNKFNVGDIVIGNELANNYVVTIQGWKGEVLKVVDVEEGEPDIWVKNLKGPEVRWVRSECFDLYDPPKETKETIEVDVDFIKQAYHMADPDLRKVMEEEFKDLFKKEDEPFNFGDEFTLGTSWSDPLIIGKGLAPKGLERRCLIVRSSYDLEVVEENDLKVLIFREKKQ